MLPSKNAIAIPTNWADVWGIISYGFLYYILVSIKGEGEKRRGRGGEGGSYKLATFETAQAKYTSLYFDLMF